MSESLATWNRIKQHKGVEAMVVVNNENKSIEESKGMDEEMTEEYAAAVRQLAEKSRSVVRDLDPMNDLTFLRIRSKRHEILIAPEKDFLLSVIQDPTSTAKKV